MAGLHAASGASSSAPQVVILTNERAGTVGIQLATGVLQPALVVASRQIGQHLTTLVPAAAQTGATKVLLANPVTVTTTQYRPLPANTALGTKTAATRRSNWYTRWGNWRCLTSGLGLPGRPRPVPRLPDRPR